MPTAYTQNDYHVVFSTKNRASLIDPDLEARLYPFLGGILRDLHCSMVAVGGMPDPVHLLVRYRADRSHSDMVRHLQGRSSRWVNETFPGRGRFAWQEGYGGFTVSRSVVPQVEAYIRNQKEHHNHSDFRAEFLELLRRHGIPLDERDVFPRADVSSPVRPKNHREQLGRPEDARA
jgi:REP element-mobilizing transposase RayT